MLWQEGFPGPDPQIPDSVERFERMRRNGGETFFDALELEDIIQYYMGRNNSQKALDATRFAVRQYPYSTNFLLTKSQLLAATGRMRMALRMLDKVESIDPFTSELYIIKGAIFCKLEKHEMASQCFNKAIIHSEQLDMTYYDIALECESLGNFRDAIRFLKKSYQANPDNPHILQELAFCFDITDQVEESIRFHRRLITEQPYHEVAWFNLGIAYCKQEKYEKALDAFEYATLIRQEYYEAHFEMGEMLSALERREEAIAAYECSLRYEHSARTLYCIGECWEDLEDYGKAARYYKRALRRDPNMPDAWFGLGITRFQEHKTQEAIQHMRKAIRLDEYNGEYWYMLGEVLQKTEDFGGAEEAYRNVIRLEPFTASVWIDLAELMMKQGRCTEAIEIAREGCNEHPDYADLFYRVSGYMLTSGQPKEGLRLLEDALTMDFKGYKAFYQAFPILKTDPNIAFLIELYQPHP